MLRYYAPYLRWPRIRNLLDLLINHIRSTEIQLPFLFRYLEKLNWFLLIHPHFQDHSGLLWNLYFQITQDFRQTHFYVFMLQMTRHFGHNQKYWLYDIVYVLKPLYEMSQRIKKLFGLVIEGVFACRKHNFYVAGLFVYLMNEKWIDYVLRNVTLLISIVHKPWKVPIYLSFVSGLMGNRSIRGHFIADWDVLEVSIGRSSKLNDHVARFRHFRVELFVFLEEMNQSSFSRTSRPRKYYTWLLFLDAFKIIF